ncbi:D-glycero-alpha-D-manno-heptose-1,7-bisphosphate 7-phosphatase [Paenibacillus sp. strain BS8-2]
MKAFILDRDGVINHAGNINRKSDFRLIDGAAEAIKQLGELGYQVFVASNQGGVGLGYMTKAALKSINGYMMTLIRAEGGDIHDVRYCTHKPHARCSCRKPQAGMLLDLIHKYGIDRQQSFMVGDRDTDIIAGEQAGVRTVFLGESIPPGIQPNFHFHHLYDAVTSMRAQHVIN